MPLGPLRVYTWHSHSMPSIIILSRTLMALDPLSGAFAKSSIRDDTVTHTASTGASRWSTLHVNPLVFSDIQWPTSHRFSSMWVSARFHLMLSWFSLGCHDSLCSRVRLDLWQGLMKLRLFCSLYAQRIWKRKFCVTVFMLQYLTHSSKSWETLLAIFAGSCGE